MTPGLVGLYVKDELAGQSFFMSKNWLAVRGTVSS